MFPYSKALIGASLFLGALVSGCSLGTAHDEHLIGPYRLSAIDTLEQMSVYYALPNGDEIGRIDETVFAVGWNDHFIVAKQHPKNSRGIINLFILNIDHDSMYAEPNKSVVGPLTELEFRKMKTELGLPDFSRTINSLE